MSHAFNIYPALFILRPIQADTSTNPEILDDDKGKNDFQISANSSKPNTFYGRCSLNNNRNQILLLFQELDRNYDVNGQLLNELKVEAFEGKKYFLIYIPVNN